MLKSCYPGVKGKKKKKEKDDEERINKKST